MRIIYYSFPFFSDCDFPLIGALQKKGYDVSYYIPIASYNKRSTLFDIKQLYPKTGIFPVLEIYKEFYIYKDVIDLSKVYILNQTHKQKYHPINILLMIRFIMRVIFENPDVVQLTQQPSFMVKLLYFIKEKLVLTVHDPFLHTGRYSKQDERNRYLAFKLIPKLILLNNKQVSDFSSHYRIPANKVYISKLGEYSCISHVTPSYSNIKGNYILYFGLIAKYKGLEDLLAAMVIVHKKHPDVKLIIAGGGKLYFDISPYKDLDYIILKNYYVPLSELAGLLKNSMFGVCPYKDATQSGVIQTAFSLGVPMVVTNVGSLPEAVEHGKSGLVVQPNDITGLSEGIDYLLSHNSILNEMRQYINTEWKRKMSWVDISADYIECYTRNE